MTTKELITELKLFPDDLEVWTTDVKAAEFVSVSRPITMKVVDGDQQHVILMPGEDYLKLPE